MGKTSNRTGQTGKKQTQGLISDQAPKQCGKQVVLTNGNTVSLHTLHTKINPKWIIDLNITHATKLREGDLDYLQNLAVGKDFLDRTQKALIKSKTLIKRILPLFKNNESKDTIN